MGDTGHRARGSRSSSGRGVLKPSNSRNATSSNSKHRSSTGGVARKPKKKETDDLICNLRMRNDLPPPPFDPKYVKIPWKPERLYNYSISSLEQQYRYRVHLEPFVGQPVHLIDPRTAEVPARLAEADKHIVRRENDELHDFYKGNAPTTKGAVSTFGNTMSLRNIQDSKKIRAGKHWLRKTEYIDNENRDARSGGTAENQKRRSELDRRQKAAQANRNKMTKFERIEASFQASKKFPKHATNPSLKPVRIFSVLPDLDMLGDTQVLVRFMDDNMLDDELLDKSQLDEKGKVKGKKGRAIVEYTEEQKSILSRAIIQQYDPSNLANASLLVPASLKEDTKKASDLSESVEEKKEEQAENEEGQKGVSDAQTAKNGVGVKKDDDGQTNDEEQTKEAGGTKAAGETKKQENEVHKEENHAKEVESKEQSETVEKMDVDGEKKDTEAKQDETQEQTVANEKMETDDGDHPKKGEEKSDESEDDEMELDESAAKTTVDRDPACDQVIIEEEQRWKWVRDYEYTIKKEKQQKKEKETFALMFDREKLRAPTSLNDPIYGSVRYVPVEPPYLDLKRNQTGKYNVQETRKKRVKVSRRPFTKEESNERKKQRKMVEEALYDDILLSSSSESENADDEKEDNEDDDDDEEEKRSFAGSDDSEEEEFGADKKKEDSKSSSDDGDDSSSDSSND